MSDFGVFLDEQTIAEMLVKKFRTGIDAAKLGGSFQDDISFYKFPRGCCGDASDLLAHYLLENEIQTWYVCGTHYPSQGTAEESWEGIQSHAWLTTADPRRTKHYQIIDITGDQFENDPEYYCFDIPAYVGPMDRFHQLFEVDGRDVHENKGIGALGKFAAPRLWRLYHIIRGVM